MQIAVFPQLWIVISVFCLIIQEVAAMIFTWGLICRRWLFYGPAFCGPILIFALAMDRVE